MNENFENPVSQHSRVKYFHTSYEALILNVHRALVKAGAKDEATNAFPTCDMN
jgi:hypothetical protein